MRFKGLVTTVFGGSGFIGGALLSRLGKNGSQVVIGYRGGRYFEEKLRVVGGLGQVYYSKFHLKDEASLYEVMKCSDVVVNLVGKESETANFTFDQVHVEGPRLMAKIAREIGVKKFIHFSALNANPNPEPICLKRGSQFLKSKYHGELAVREEFPDAIIFRPADVMGDGDNFLNHFASMQRARYTHKLPLWDYYDDVVKQPVFLKDLIDGVERAIADDTTQGKTYQAVGPYRYDFYELIEYMRACAGMGQKLDERRITNLRWDITRFIIPIVTKLQKYPYLTWERVERDLTSDYVDPSLPTLVDLGVELTPLELQIQILAHYRPREHRVEIPFEQALRIDLPKKLNVAN